jgi:hypothetical protein
MSQTESGGFLNGPFLRARCGTHCGTLMLPLTSLLRRVPSVGVRLRCVTALPARAFAIAAAEPPSRRPRRRAVPHPLPSFSRCASGASSPPPPSAASLPGEPRAAPSKPDYKGDAQRFIEERGYEARVAKGVVDTLLQPGMGVTPGTLMGTVERLAGHFDIDLDAGLEALAKAVEQELMKVEGKALVSIVVQPSVGEAFTAKAYEVTAGDYPCRALRGPESSEALDALPPAARADRVRRFYAEHALHAAAKTERRGHRAPREQVRACWRARGGEGRGRSGRRAS